MTRPGPKRAKKQDETAYLLRSPANAKRLLDSIEAARRGKLIRKKLKLDR